jgi:aerobic C4-dicarboxylate transport protein
LLQVLFFSVLFGIRARRWWASRAAPVRDLLSEDHPRRVKLVGILKRAARSVPSARWPSPSANTASNRSPTSPGLVATFYLTSAIFVLGVLGRVARYNGFSIFKLIRYIKEELLLVLGTSSSEAALPS